MRKYASNYKHFSFYLGFLFLFLACGHTKPHFPPPSEKTPKKKEPHPYFSFLQAQDASLKNKAKEAYETFKSLSLKTKGKERLFIQQKMSIELIRMGKVKEGKELLESLSLKNAPHLKIMLAGIYLSESNIKKARPILEKAINSSPINHEACRLYAKVFYLEKNEARRWRNLKKCRQSYFKKEAQLAMSQLMLIKGEFHEAEKELENILEADPTNKEALKLLAAPYKASERMDQIIPFYENFLSSGQEDGKILQEVVSYYLKNNDTPKAKKYLTKAVKTYPKHVDALVNLSLIHLNEKEFLKAKKYLTQAKSVIHDSDKINFYYGITLSYLKEYSEATSVLLTIKQENELSKQSTLLILENYRQSLLEDKAIVTEEEFISFAQKEKKRLPSLQLEISLFLVNYFEEKKNFNQAIAELLSLDETRKLNSQTRFYLASLYNKNGNLTEAHAQIKKILAQNPHHSDALNFIGYTLLEKEKITESFPYLQKAYTYSPQNGQILDSLGLYYYKLGNYPKAIEKLEAAQGKIKDDPTIMRHLIEAYLAAQYTNKAQELYYNNQRFLDKHGRYENFEAFRKELAENP